MKLRRDRFKILVSVSIEIYLLLGGQSAFGLSRVTLLVIAIALMQNGIQKLSRGFDDGIS